MSPLRLALVLALALVASTLASIPASFLTDRSLLLIPAQTRAAKEEPHFLTRVKRRIDNDPLTTKKYHRLAHAVHVQSDIRYRYATTLVTSEVRNPEHEAREVFLTVILPDTAFISRFAIEVGGQLFVAYVKEKTEAWKEYQSAVATGKTAGHVGISARHSNHFRVSVNTEAKTSVIFYLLYEELLQRRGGIYEHVINLTPRQKLKDFAIDVSIVENKNITYLHVPSLRRHEISVDAKSGSPGLSGARVQQSGGRARVQFRPELQDLQSRLKSKHALQFVVEYDVEREGQGGEIQVRDGYFVHFVAPSNLPPMPKHVVFILDISGSMMGKKMEQTRSAMRTILGEMRSRDYLTVISFSDNATTWSHQDKIILEASPANLAAAIDYVDHIEAAGGTNLNDALVLGLTIATHVEQRRDVLIGVQPMIFFLTDGHPTVGETETLTIMANVNKANYGSLAPIFSLAFGRHADFDLLKVMSLQNNGFARKIYVAADASLQLEGFYKEVSSPILRDVQFKYQENEILAHSLTSTNFHTFYQGSEMVVAGRLPVIKDDMIKYEILANKAEGGEYKVKGQYNGSEAHLYPQVITETHLFDVEPQVRTSDVNFLERLWAYLTIQDLLEKVAKGELKSCEIEDQPQSPDPQVLPRQQGHQGRRRRSSFPIDDEDFDGSGEEEEEIDDDELGYDYQYEYQDRDVDAIMEEVGDADIIICDNLERALYLSLKYEFVTPLTSLVVVKPDKAKENGDFGEIGPFEIRMMSKATAQSLSTALVALSAFLAFLGHLF